MNKIFENKNVRLFADILLFILGVMVLTIWPTPMLISAPSTISVMLGIVVFVATVMLMGIYFSKILKGKNY